MNWTIEIWPEALEDLEQAGAWYEQQQVGLGAEFAREIRRAIARLPANPFLFPLRNRKRNVRWFFPARFPYRIVYRIEADRLTVVAVRHAARSNGEWTQRLSRPRP
jgi:toxin ParE1/3/4